MPLRGSCRLLFSSCVDATLGKSGTSLLPGREATLKLLIAANLER